jgi:NAD-dependent deacetylase
VGQLIDGEAHRTRLPAMVRVDRYQSFAPLDLTGDTRVFVLTGAGISAESGIQTFRDAGGLWEQHRFEDVASPEGWTADPALVWRFYSLRRAQAATVAANAAHQALATLEAKLGDRLFLCTQNVDPLHERGGSRRVVHMHGELMKSRCERDHAPPFDDEATYHDANALPRCRCGARIRPHICWFGEIPFHMDMVHEALGRSNLFVTIGSSGAVYPAVSCGWHARPAPKRCTSVPKRPTTRTRSTNAVSAPRPKSSPHFSVTRAPRLARSTASHAPPRAIRRYLSSFGPPVSRACTGLISTISDAKSA